jgi:hypothetical protein
MPARLGRLRATFFGPGMGSLLHGRRASDYELDHIIPIGVGGAVLDRRNLGCPVPVMHT